MPLGVSSTITCDGSLSPCLRARSIGMINVADILLVRKIFETSFALDIHSKYITIVIYLLGCIHPKWWGIEIMKGEDKWKKLIQKKLSAARVKALEPYTTEKESRILEVIRNHGIKGGISHNQLAQIVDLDRKSLRRYTQPLLGDKKIRRDGTHGKYFPTEEAYKDPLLKATLFGDDFRFKLLDEKKGLVLCDQIIEDYEINRVVDCTTYSSLYKPMFTTEDEIEQTLFEFSNRVGAFITYALIQAMNPENNKMLLSTRGQDEIVKKWAQNSISRILPFLVKNFNDFVYIAIGQYPRGYDEQVKFMDKSPRFVLDGSTISKLLTAFRRLYPRLGYEFDKMIMNLPEALDNYKKFIEEMREKRKQQQSCEHVYKEPATMTLYGYYGKQCSKCHYIKRVKNPDPPQKR